jgi:hypothetical protein
MGQSDSFPLDMGPSPQTESSVPSEHNDANVAELPQKNHSDLEKAALYLCGANTDRCKEYGVLDKEIAELMFDDRIFTNRSFLEECRQLLQVIHEAKACIWPSVMDWSFRSEKFKVWSHFNKGDSETWTDFDPNLLKKFVQSCQKNLIGIEVDLSDKMGGHANMLIANKIHRTIEHFEPWGENVDIENYDGILESLRGHLEKVFPGYTYIPPAQVCPDISLVQSEPGFSAEKTGIQSFLNTLRPGSKVGGTCAIWSLWYLNVRLASPHLTSQEALKQATALALDLDQALLKEGLDKNCLNLIKRYNKSNIDWICGDKSSLEPLEPDTQAIKTMCPTFCDWARTPSTIEEFVTRFIKQLISLLNPQIRYAYILLKKKNDDIFREFVTLESATEAFDQLPAADKQNWRVEPGLFKIVRGNGRLLVKRPMTGQEDPTPAAPLAPLAPAAVRQIPTPKSAKFVVYGIEDCTYCDRADKRVLQINREQGSETGLYVKVSEYASTQFNTFVKPSVPSTYTTWPKVFYNGNFIGGYNELVQNVAATKNVPKTENTQKTKNSGVAESKFEKTNRHEDGDKLITNIGSHIAHTETPNKVQPSVIIVELSPKPRLPKRSNSRKMKKTIINPRTGREIKVGKDVHRQLCREDTLKGEDLLTCSVYKNEPDANTGAGYLTNPLTNRRIKYGGPTHLRLCREGVLTG